MSALNTLLDSLTFGLTDLDNSEDYPGYPNVTYNMSDQEEQMLELITSNLQSLGSVPFSELEANNKKYYDQLMSEEFLSDAELSGFDKEYDLQLKALQQKYDTQFRDASAGTMANLAHRGVLETTTGSNVITNQQRDYADALASDTASLLNEKQLKIMDAEEAKRQMALQGYNLTSGILQQKQSNALTSAGLLQNYFTNQQLGNVGTQVQNYINQQSWAQYVNSQNQNNITDSAGAWTAILDMFGG